MSPREFRTGPVTAPPPGYKLSRYAWLPLDMVYPDPENARTDLGDLTDLVASMREVGLISPIEVRATPEDPRRDFVITAGHRRYAAAQVLGWSNIESVIRGPMPTVDVLERMVAENGQREPLDPLDEGAAFRVIFQARKYGSVVQLAHRVGRSVAYVSGRLALLDLPPAEQQRLRAGDVTIADAIEVARQVSGRTQSKAATKKKAATPKRPTPVPGGVRGAIARALRSEAEWMLAQGHEVAALRLSDRAAQFETGKAPLP